MSPYQSRPEALEVTGVDESPPFPRGADLCHSARKNMFLTGLTHRRRLYNVVMRWLTDRPRPSDGRTVTEIFTYDGVVSIAEARAFMGALYAEVFGAPLTAHRIHYKHELRELALEAIGTPTARHYQMMEAYHSNPEAFFRRMPIDGVLVFAPDARLIGGYRIKRPRRVAEKASRRVADHLGGLIRARAEDLAARRASAQGTTLHALTSSPEQERSDFLDAEAWLSERFRKGSIRIPTDALPIDDVIGFKIIGTPEDLARTEAFIDEYPGATVFEREEHRGEYNAVNILVDLELPTPDQIIERFAELDWMFVADRGLSPEQLAHGFPDFIRGAARSIRLELILTTFDEFLESELGRCMHEYRILEQRERRDYRGRMAKNAEFIIEYLLAVAYAPTTEIQEIPVKMWGQYLPETLSYASRKLVGRHQVGLIITTPHTSARFP